jgi:uncharacterized damage-inducible protein DinB
MKRVLLVVVCAIVFALPATAQPPAQAGGANADVIARTLKTSFDTIARYIAASAEKMPDVKFGFKPTPEVMSFGELVGHVADTHFSYCSRVKAEKNPNDGNSIQKKTAKADIVKGLTDSIAYCTDVYAGMTDAKAIELLAPPAPPAGQAPPATPPAPSPKFRILMGNVTHDWEHYGNLVTYLRINGLVPPSSEPRK